MQREVWRVRVSAGVPDHRWAWVSVGTTDPRWGRVSAGRRDRRWGRVSARKPDWRWAAMLAKPGFSCADGCCVWACVVIPEVVTADGDDTLRGG
jgi:hypothetical protein